MPSRLTDPSSLDKKTLETGAVFAPLFDSAGLIPAIAQEADSGEVLMMAWMNREAVEKTLDTGQVHYWSRSRNSLWLKGETSGQIQTVQDIRIDCDQDVLLLKVKVGGDGGCCHVGRQACFFRQVGRDGTLTDLG